MDVIDDLLDRAKKEVPNVKFILSDITNKNSLPSEKI